MLCHRKQMAPLWDKPFAHGMSLFISNMHANQPSTSLLSALREAHWSQHASEFERTCVNFSASMFVPQEPDKRDIQEQFEAGRVMDFPKTTRVVDMKVQMQKNYDTKPPTRSFHVRVTVDPYPWDTVETLSI